MKLRNAVPVALLCMASGIGGVAIGQGVLAGHPNLVEAHRLIVQALGKVTDAQRYRGNDAGGHIFRAKHLLIQADNELKAAASQSDLNGW